MQACGNDFVVIDHRGGVPHGFLLTPALSAKVSHRQFGVGCDQILWLQPPVDPSARAKVIILNADGSEAEMCGNGMRALAVLIGERRSGRDGRDQVFMVEAMSGPVEMSLSGKYPSVKLGVPKVVEAQEKIQLVSPGGATENESFTFTRVDMGNPHAVFFLPHVAFGNLSDLDLGLWGRLVEYHAAFPNRTNVGFAQVESRKKIRARIWERGAGATLACGSGACAVAAAAEALGFTEAGAEIEIVLPGGSVYVRLENGWREGTGRVHLSGPAEIVFRGEWTSPT